MSKAFLMPLSELLDKYMPVYPKGHDWDKTVTALMSWPVEKETVEKLIEHLKRDGVFKEPVMLCENLDLEDELDAQYYIGNGTHRVVASILAGSETILAIREEDMEPWHDDPFFVETIIESTGDLDEDAYDALRSFQTPTGEWVESSFSSITKSDENDKKWLIHLWWDHEPYKHPLTTLTDWVRDRLNGHMDMSKISSIDSKVSSYDEE